MNTTFTTYAEKKAKQFLNLLQGYTKGIRITAILILLLMGVSNAWGATYPLTVNYPYVYLDNSSLKWDGCNVVVGHDSYSYGYLMTKIENTNLFYKEIPANWGDAKGIVFIKETSQWGEWKNQSLWDRTKDQTRTGYQWDNQYESMDYHKTYLCTSTGSNDLIISYQSSGYSALNSQQTINTVVDGTVANSKATINITSYAMTGNGTATEQTATLGTGADASYIDAARTATTTLTVGTVATGYQFDGWYAVKTGGTALSTSTTYTYYPTAATTVYARFSIKKHTVNFGVHSSGNGTLTAKVGNTSISHGNKVNYGSEVVFTATPSTGYQIEGWYSNSDCTTPIDNGTNKTYTVTITGGTNVYVKFKAKEYTITYKDQGGSNFSGTHESGYPTTHTYGTATTLSTATKDGYTFGGWHTDAACDNQVTSLGATAYTSDITLYAKWTANTYTVRFEKNANEATGTMDNQSFTYDEPQNLTKNKFTLARYSFAGWATTIDGEKAYDDAQEVSNLTPINEGTVTLYAKWAAKITYTVTLDQTGAETYGTTTSVAATFGDPMPTITSLPTPADGYAFMGYWDGKDGTGTQYYNAKGESVREWNQEKDAILYAYFKKAEITSITLDKTLFESGETGFVTVTSHEIAPNPAGTTVVCWQLCYTNGTPVEGHNAIEENGTVKFAIDGLSAGTYKIVASLRLNDCTGEEIDTAEATFVVAGSYTVTIKYTCDGQEIAGRTTIEGHPSRQTAVTAAEIGGYNFVKWVLGDGITSTSTLTNKTINITANYEGYLTATYEKKKLIFLDLSKKFGTADWTAPHIYLYSAEFWNKDKGTGTKTNCVAKGAMSPVPGTTDMWFYEYEKVDNFNGYVAFTPTDKMSQEYFYDTEVIHRGDFSIGTPVFVPAVGQTANIKNPSEGKNAQYYNKGHWTKYMGGTGYTLKIYNHKEEEGRKELMSVPFTGSSLYLPFTAVVDLEAGQTFGYKIVRDNDKWYKNDNDGTMTVNSHTNWPFVEDNSNGLACGIKTVAAGNHTFTLTLDATSGDFKVSVDYPVTVGDYRILYKDDTRTTYKPSDIKKAEELNPVTSFFIRPYKNPELIVQTAARVSNEGVTWYADNHIYFKPNANWKSDGARFAAYFYNASNNKWVDLKANGDLYSCIKPTDKVYTHVIFCRMDPSKNNAWGNVWTQTIDIELPTDKNLYTLEEGGWKGQVRLKPNANWKSGNARFAAYFFHKEGEETKKEEWYSMYKDDDSETYWCPIPDGCSKVIFCRMMGDKEENIWGNKWDQTNDLEFPTGDNECYTIKEGAWSNGDGSWSNSGKSWSTINGSITDLSVQLKNKLAELDLEDIKETEGSVFNIHLSNNEGTLTIEKVAFYTGNFYIRVDAAAGKWYDYKTNPDNLMTYSPFSESDANSFGEKFSHYKTKWCPRGTNVKFVIANDYSPCISDTITRDLIKASGKDGEDYMTEGGDLYQEDGGSKDPVDDRFSANIRFMWNRKTNKISRAYLASSSNDSRQFLVLKGCQEIKDENGNNLSGNGDNHNEFRALLQDTQDWIYERTFKVRPGTRVKLYACYANTTVSPATAQYFRGKHDDGNCGSAENSVQILGGNGTEWEKIRVIYDFKTNRLIGAWVPSGEISETQTIAADVMIMRNHQEDATCITLAEGKSLDSVKTVYGALRFNRWTLNNKDANTHQALSIEDQKTIYERALFFISFPFDVHLSDAFGLGTYGTHWVISTYNGKRRAERGYFAEDCINEDCTNWDYIWDPTDFVMKANEGYLLSLDLELMKDDDNSFWPHNINYRELFFPSQVELETITKTNYTMPELGPEYECKINLNTTDTEPEKDRTVKDSYWRCIGVPSFADYDVSLTDGNDATITWQPDGDNLPFLYEWNVTNNNLVVRSATNYRFRPTFAYLIQNGGKINWTAVNTNEPNPIIARERSEAISNYEWKIALLRNGNTEDQTFVRISDNEAVTAAFDFNQDLAKEFNYGANIYTLVGYERLAANSLPMSDSTTIIPLGVSAQEAGDYTITMPEGVESIGITLVDTETGTRTNLSAGMEYTFTLDRGTYDSRLYLEISPIEKTPSDLEYVDEATRNQNVRKFIIDGKLYLQKDGMLYDAQGHIVR